MVSKTAAKRDPHLNAYHKKQDSAEEEAKGIQTTWHLLYGLISRCC
jgi:hypothetical protein